ncbi:AAA family ATPase [Mucilaginibacter lacusdianchii]|uniref:AAA family ATPase n=1 Tax=Mucilaginibacter lacusdianchii TaxID=2684211 RepID=UPI00131BAC63|nr:AAA family ATPase [Mucilaginibacter sp. JXJ CY 39]
MSRIRIQNVGPVREGYRSNDGWLDISNMTVFIGNQGSGKSTVAKLISTMSWIEKALVRGDFGSQGLDARQFRSHVSYQNIEHYLRPDSIIEYEGRAYFISYVRGEVTFQKNEENGYAFPKIMYVPSERNFLSSVRNVDVLKGLPSTLYTFSDEFIAALESLSGQVDLPVNDAKFEYQELTRTSYISGSDYQINLTQASSGFQSFVPLYVVSHYLATSLNKKTSQSTQDLSIEESKRIRREIEDLFANPNISDEVRKASLEYLSSRFSYSSFVNIVEEPEQNLFPSSQQQVLNSLIRFKNMHEQNKLVVTTHSPYIINFLSIAIQAGSLLKRDIPTELLDKIKRVVPIESTLKAEEVAVYQFDEQRGSICDLPNFEGIPSDKNYLNQFLSAGNEAFDTLLEIEQEL